MKPKYEVADVFQLYGKQYKKSHAMSEEQRKVMEAITICRTAELGGHQEVCTHCGIIRNCYNSCRNRHCPKCQTLTKERWLDKRREELLPCSYYHLVFTVPHLLNPLILANRWDLLKYLFHSVKKTIFTFAADPQWRLEGKPGVLSILHTWSQTMIDHFHIHCLVPAGVLSFDGEKWIPGRQNYLFGAKSLAKLFKKNYLAMIEANLDQLELPEGSHKALIQAREKNWICYAKKPFAGPEQVLSYLGRYTHKIAISNHRIKSIKDGRVIFSYKDRNNDNQTKFMNLDAMEFIRRFLLHVLPKGFMKIRYYGFLANICKKKAVELIRRLIGIPMKIISHAGETIQEHVLRLPGRDITLCSQCKKPRMILYLGPVLFATG
jgi:hypothetical protein